MDLVVNVMDARIYLIYLWKPTVTQTQGTVSWRTQMPQMTSLVPRLHPPAFYRTVYKSGEGAWYISSRDMRHAVT